MRRRLGSIRDSIVNRTTGVKLREVNDAFYDFLHVQYIWRDEDIVWRRQLDEELAQLRRRSVAQTELLRRRLDDTPSARAKLDTWRASSRYEKQFQEPEPLVTVRIAAYQKTEELIDVALASVFRQSYERLEVIIVNDGPNERTRRAIAALDDPRVTFHETSERGRYPEDSRSRWMVAGGGVANRAARLANGTWLAPLDDDDEFTPDHVEKLVSLAIAHQAELAYGALTQKNLINGVEERIWSTPPAISQFSFQGALYLKQLSEIFEYSDDAWLLDEPADWNLVRRMRDAGVRMSATPEVVAIMNMVPYTHKESEQGTRQADSGLVN